MDSYLKKKILKSSLIVSLIGVLMLGGAIFLPDLLFNLIQGKPTHSNNIGFVLGGLVFLWILLFGSMYFYCIKSVEKGEAEREFNSEYESDDDDEFLDDEILDDEELLDDDDEEEENKK